MILVVKPESVPALRGRLAANPAVEIFAASDSLLALGAILQRAPRIVALDRTFVDTARGAALIARVKADPSLAAVNLRVLAEDAAELSRLLGESIDFGDDTMAGISRPLDHCGTRCARRFTMPRDARLIVNGEPSRLVNLSVTGAQVVTRLRLQPGQGARLVLADGDREKRLRASVAWSSLELAGAVKNYRAGLQFADPDEAWLESYCVSAGADRAVAS